MNYLQISDDKFLIVKDWYKVECEWRCHVLVSHPGSGWREMNGNWTQVPQVVCVGYEEHHTGELACKGLHAKSSSYRYSKPPETHEQARRWVLDDLVESYDWVVQIEQIAGAGAN